MEIIPPRLKYLLEQDNDENFEDSAVIQDLILPFLTKWTNIVSSNQSYTSSVESQCWWDLYGVLNRLSQNVLLLCLSQAEYLLDIILQHVQVDMFDSDVKTWTIASKCFLLFLESVGAAVWQETSCSAEDFFDNLQDIYQSVDASRAAGAIGSIGVMEHRCTLQNLSDTSKKEQKPSIQDLSLLVLVLELMMAMVLKPVHLFPSSYCDMIAGCIGDLMSHLHAAQCIQQQQEKQQKQEQKQQKSDQKKANESDLLTEVMERFSEIVESYLTDTTKNFRSLIILEIQTSQEKLSSFRRSSGHGRNNSDHDYRSNINNGDSSYSSVLIPQSDEIIYIKTNKTVPLNCFSIMLRTLPLLSEHKHLFQFPDLLGHILSCHSHLCIIPQVKKMIFVCSFSVFIA